MHSAVRSLRLFLLGLLLLAVFAIQPAWALEKVRLGTASIAYDPARWRGDALSLSAIEFTPQGAIAGKLDHVSVERFPVSGGHTCSRLAEQLLTLHGYRLTPLIEARTAIGGVQGTRYAAHNGCRNATPLGVVSCLKVGGDLYVLSALQIGCGGQNLFSGIDPLGEISDGISFDKK